MPTLETVRGYFLPQDQETTDSDDYSSGEEDYADIDDVVNLSNTGGNFIQSDSRKRTGTFKCLGSNRRLKLHGLFWSMDPWWEVQVKIERNTQYSVKYIKNYPAYQLRSDDQVAAQNIVQLFLTGSRITSYQHVQSFLDAVRSWGEEHRLTFGTIDELLERFSHENVESAMCMQKALKSCIFLDPDLKDLFFYLPRLVGRKFSTLLKKQDSSKPYALLHDIAEALRKEHWILGFSSVLALRYKLYGIEVSLQGFKDAGLFETIPQPQSVALKIYDQLKNECRKKGHTYITQGTLPEGPNEALEYLEEIETVVWERETKKVYWKKLWNAEQQITEGITHLMVQDSKQPLTFTVDFKRPEFESILEDEHQKEAVECICRSPVTLLSGRGGCGKTHIVSTLFRHLSGHIKSQSVNPSDSQETLDFSQDTDIETLFHSVSETEKIVPICDQKFEQHMKQENGEPVMDEVKYEDAAEVAGTVCRQIELDFSQNTDIETLFQAVSGTEKTVPICDQKFEQHTKQEHGEPVMDEVKCEDAAEVAGTVCYQIEPGRILITAPTGKAANLLEKKTGLTGYTLHHVIYSYYGWRKECKSNPDETISWVLSDIEVLVVDECSLVSVTTFASMLRILLDNSNLRKLVLLGDIDQLPSIEPGNFLADVHKVLNEVGLCVKLLKNHRSTPSGQLIVENAKKIASQKMPDIDDARHFHLLTGEEWNSSEGTRKAQEVPVPVRLRRLLISQEIPIGSDKNSQFIAFRRQDCDIINDICREHYVGRPMKVDQKRRQFSVNDKVCCTKNTVVRDELTKEEIRLRNGEIYFITGDRTEDRTQHRYLQLLNPDTENLIEVEAKTLISKCKLTHAWARTIHTFQGSECHTIIYVVGRSWYQNWQHVYTAVTRGQDRVVIIAKTQELRTAVKQLAKKRQTGLFEQLINSLFDLPQKVRQMWLSNGAWRGVPKTPKSEKKFLPRTPSRTPNGKSVSTVTRLDSTTSPVRHASSKHNQGPSPPSIGSKFRQDFQVAHGAVCGNTVQFTDTLIKPKNETCWKRILFQESQADGFVSGTDRLASVDSKLNQGPNPATPHISNKFSQVSLGAEHGDTVTFADTLIKPKVATQSGWKRILFQESKDDMSGTDRVVNGRHSKFKTMVKRSPERQNTADSMCAMDCSPDKSPKRPLVVVDREDSAIPVKKQPKL